MMTQELNINKMTRQIAKTKGWLSALKTRRAAVKQRKRLGIAYVDCSSKNDTYLEAIVINSITLFLQNRSDDLNDDHREIFNRILFCFNRVISIEPFGKDNVFKEPFEEYSNNDSEFPSEEGVSVLASYSAEGNRLLNEIEEYRKEGWELFDKYRHYLDEKCFFLKEEK